MFASPTLQSQQFQVWRGELHIWLRTLIIYLTQPVFSKSHGRHYLAYLPGPFPTSRVLQIMLRPWLVPACHHHHTRIKLEYSTLYPNLHDPKKKIQKPLKAFYITVLYSTTFIHPKKKSKQKGPFFLLRLNSSHINSLQTAKRKKGGWVSPDAFAPGSSGKNLGCQWWMVSWMHELWRFKTFIFSRISTNIPKKKYQPWSLMILHFHIDKKNGIKFDHLGFPNYPKLSQKPIVSSSAPTHVCGPGSRGYTGGCAGNPCGGIGIPDAPITGGFPHQK